MGAPALWGGAGGGREEGFGRSGVSTASPPATVDADILRALGPVAQSLSRQGVQWHVGGSVASCIWGEPRSTLDVDIVAALTPDQARTLAKDLSDEFYADRDAMMDAARSRGCFNVIHLATMLKVDVYLPGEGAHDVASFARRRPWQAGPGEGYSVASPEDTVLHKLRWYRLGGHVADRQWRDVVGVLIVQSGELEEDYMRRHATELGIDDLLSRAEREAASIGF